MNGNLKLPVGIDDFRKIRECGFYYVDKTKLVEQLMQNWDEVNLFTRPRRFGKTLNMSMLRSFFEIGTDKSLFDGLYISRNKELCDMHMGKYPVISITLKGIEGMTFEEARNMLKIILKNEARRHYYLKNSDRLTYDDGSVQNLCEAFMAGDADKIQNNLNMMLIKTISVLDTKARDNQKENFYHGLLLGLLRSKHDWRIKSNRESGDEFSDISIEPTIPEKGIVIEVKYANTISGLDDACGRAMKQIRDRRYDEALREDGREDIIAYGIAFCRKRCKVVCEKM